MSIRITALTTTDLRFPTSDFLDGSDAMNVDPDYSAAYVRLHTDESALVGHGFTFTLGRGNEICLGAIEALRDHVVGRSLDELEADMGRFWRDLTGDSQLRWLGPEKGIIHLATAAIVNAVWDLLARRSAKPLWQYVCDWPAERIVASIDFRHITDALGPEEALDILQRQQAMRDAHERQLRDDGYPAYITSAGWLGYDDDKVRARCREALAAGWDHFKMKVGRDVEDDVRRARILREEIGPDRRLMLDANQVWDVDDAIEWMKPLAEFHPWWIEEPTSPDDILGHARIRQAVQPIGVATGEHCHNRVMWKQLFQAEAVDFCQIDGCRLGGLNEVLAVMLMAAKFGVPVCPHAGGVGLCEYVQHFSIIDYLCISGSTDGRMTEYADHLHEHFVAPVRIRDGRYLMPDTPGFSAEIKPQTLAAYQFPDGRIWKERE